MAAEPNDADSSLEDASFDESEGHVELLGSFGFRVELFDGDEGAGDGHGEGFLSGGWGWGDEASEVWIRSNGIGRGRRHRRFLGATIEWVALVAMPTWPLSWTGMEPWRKMRSPARIGLLRQST